MTNRAILITGGSKELGLQLLMNLQLAGMELLFIILLLLKMPKELLTHLQVLTT